MHDDHVRRSHELRDRRKILVLVRQVRTHARVDGEAAADDEHRVAVCRRARDQLSADHRRGARAIVNDDLLTPHFAELLTDQPGKEVCAAAGRKRHDDAHRLDGKILRVGRSSKSSNNG